MGKAILAAATAWVMVAGAAVCPAHAQTPSSEAEAFQTSLRADLDRQYDRVVADLIRITETPAPPFKEAARAALLAQMLRDAGLDDVTIDAEGNVLALRPGTQEGPVFVVSAHLDTVFPEGTPIKVTRDGDRLFAPGIGDDSLGLASMLAWVRHLESKNIATSQPILFVATVGEEGAGDLRGVRHLFTQGEYKDRIGAFLSIDNTNAGRIVHAAVGSRRYRITFSGPGRHSYGAFGIVNPMAAMAETVRGIYAIAVPSDPKTTYAAAGENAARSTRDGTITLVPELIGDRPAGMTPVDHPLVQTAFAASQAAGFKARLDDSSTDSNIPMSLGIPALTIGSGAGGGRTHSTEEYLNIERERFVAGLSVGLAVILAQTQARPR